MPIGLDVGTNLSCAFYLDKGPRMQYLRIINREGTMSFYDATTVYHVMNDYSLAPTDLTVAEARTYAPPSDWETYIHPDTGAVAGRVARDEHGDEFLLILFPGHEVPNEL